MTDPTPMRVTFEWTQNETLIFTGKVTTVEHDFDDDGTIVRTVLQWSDGMHEVVLRNGVEVQVPARREESQ